jgi:regulator of replication initiation timing
MEDQLESLVRENEELKKMVQELQEENKSLWFMLEEQKNSHNAIGQALETMLKETLEEQLLKTMKPVGDA